MVHGDRREEQIQRWDWREEPDAVRVVREACGRGLRVRVHRSGGDLVGSALLRPVMASSRHVARDGMAGHLAGTPRPDARSEDTTARLRAALDAQQREIDTLRRSLATQERRLAKVASVAERVDEVEAHLAAMVAEVAAWAEAS